MGTTIIKEGTTLPVALLLTDGATGKYPQAEMYGPTGGLLSTTDLPHRAKGLYTPAASLFMPIVDYVVMVYIVYDDAGHTLESSAHARSSEIFSTATYMELVDTVDGAVTVGTTLARMNSVAAGKITRISGNQYAYRNADDSVTLFTNEDNETERVPV